MIEAPFTPEQVEKLNAWQHGPVHPFTCGRRDEPGHKLRSDEDLGQLYAAEDGWHCRDCDYTQKWAHDFMLIDPSDWADPSFS